jgi:hypothetical protein
MLEQFPIFVTSEALVGLFPETGLTGIVAQFSTTDVLILILHQVLRAHLDTTRIGNEVKTGLTG